MEFVALPVPEIIAGTLKLLSVPEYAHAPFSPKFLMGFCSGGPVNVPAKFKLIALRVPEIIAVANPQSWGRGGCRGSGKVPFERALVSPVDHP